MKSNSIISIVAVFGLLLVVSVHSQTTNSPGKDDSRDVRRSIWDAVKQLRSERKEMKDAGKIDDQKLIQDVTALASVVQAGVASLPAQLKAQATSQLTAIQAQIKAMTTAGKFDDNILKSFHDMAKSLRDATNPKTATTVASGK